MCVRLELQSLTSLSTARPKGTVLNAVWGLCTRLQIAVWSVPVRTFHFDPRRRRTRPRARWGRHHPAGRRRGPVHGQIDARMHAVAVAGVGNTAHNDARGCVLRHESHGTQHQQRHHRELVIHEIRTSFHKNRRAPPPVLFQPSEKICVLRQILWVDINYQEKTLGPVFAKATPRPTGGAGVGVYSPRTRRGYVVGCIGRGYPHALRRGLEKVVAAKAAQYSAPGGAKPGENCVPACEARQILSRLGGDNLFQPQS